MTTRFATALVTHDDSKAAAQAAVEQAKEKLEGLSPLLAIVYCGTRYDYEAVVRTVREATGRIPLIGASTGGEFTQESVSHGSVALGLLASDTLTVRTAGATGLSGDEAATMRAIAAEATGEDDDTYPYKAGILLFDGLQGKGAEATVHMANALGVEIPLVGGAAGDDLKFEKSHVFWNDVVLHDGAVLCILRSKAPFFTSVRHGHTPLSRELRVTKAKGSVVYEVDGRPAWEVWKELAGEDAKSLGIDVAALNTPQDEGTFLIRYELGMDMGEGHYKVRVPLSRNDDGSLNFACSVPEGVPFRIMKSEQKKQIASAQEAMEAAKDSAGDCPIAGALVFDCVCRGIILGDRFSEATQQFTQVLGPDVPLLGWETYGEVCMHPGEFSGFHNTTSVVLLIAANTDCA